MSWGAKTDEMVFIFIKKIETKLETGDLLIIKNQGFFDRYLGIPWFSKHDTDVGLIFRTVSSIYVITVNKADLQVIYIDVRSIHILSF